MNKIMTISLYISRFDRNTMFSYSNFINLISNHLDPVNPDLDAPDANDLAMIDQRSQCNGPCPNMN
jgi:hypothetical protein